MKPRISQLDQSGANDQDVVTWDDTLGEWVAQAPTSGSSGYTTVKDEGTSLTARSIIDFVGAGVTATDDGSSKTIVTIPGGGGTTLYDRRWAVGSAETSIDEFNDQSLAGGWTRVDSGGGSGRATWTEDADVLSVYNSGNDSAAEMHAQMISVSSLSAGDAFVTCQTICGPLGSSFSMGGIILADGTTYGSGTQAIALSYISTAGALNWDCRAFTGYNTNTSTAGAALAPFGMLYSRLVMLSTNTFRHDISPDGVSWIKGTANLSLTLTPTHVGLLSSSWSTVIKHVTSYEFIRRVSGIT